MNPCRESTYNFLTKIVEYLKSKHSKFNGFHRIVHMGGDEVPHMTFNLREKNVWENSPACLKLIGENGKIEGATWQNFQPTDLR